MQDAAGDDAEMEGVDERWTGEVEEPGELMQQDEPPPSKGIAKRPAPSELEVTPAGWVGSRKANSKEDGAGSLGRVQGAGGGGLLARSMK